jgi:hypothetical protein
VTRKVHVVYERALLLGNEQYLSYTINFYWETTCSNL